jgi:hypothetical protein
MRTHHAQRQFKKWLNKLESADTFLRSKRSCLFYKGLSYSLKRRVRAKLAEVDPEGLKRLTANLSQISRDANQRKKMAKADGPTSSETRIAIRESVEGAEGVAKIRFMDVDGLKGVVSLCRAAGYSPTETGAFLGMEPSDVNSLVTEADIKRALRRMPDAVRMAADQIVMQDLLQGEVTDRTERADRIVDRRTKHAISAHQEKREDRKESKELQEMRKRHWKDRFGVAVVEDVTEETDEDSQAGQIGQSK